MPRANRYFMSGTVRAVAVTHPEDWVHGGYQEILGHRRRNTCIDLPALADALELKKPAVLRSVHREWIEEVLRGGVPEREEVWPKSVAVGSEEFAQRTQTALGLRGRCRRISRQDGPCVLREAEAGYGAVLGVKNGPIVPRNALYWDVSF